MADKWVIRKRFSQMWGSPGMYWRISHPSIPQGKPLYGSVHMGSFADAIEYATNRKETP